MKITKNVLLLCLVLGNTPALFAQSVIHPWHVVDNGGGTASSGGITLQASAGQPAIAVMSASGTMLESGYIPGLRFYSGTNATFTEAVSDGWNLLSVPIIPADSHKTVLYPSAISSAFSYSNGYSVQTLLANGVGYWLKFPSPASVPFTGPTLSQESVGVAAGWNMIGVPSYLVPLSDITPVGTTVISNYFGYSTANGYTVADTLEPGDGYWVKVSTAGKLFLKSAFAANTPKTIVQAGSKKKNSGPKTFAGTKSMDGIEQLTVTDANGNTGTLFFSLTRSDIDPAKYELPPPPPEGTMDVRYGTNRMVEIADPREVKEVDIQVLSAQFPVVIRWDMTQMPNGASLIVDGKAIEMRSTPSTQISSARGGLTSHIHLHLWPFSVINLPKTFALYQNFPNPFNPTTIIKYDLPKDAHVTLKIYNALGQEVRTVRDEVENAGFRSVQWNGTNDLGASVASGVYFYRIHATAAADPGKPFVDVKKMILLR